MNINRVFLAGNLTRDVEVRFLQNDKAVASFGLAINRKWKDQSGAMKEEVTFVDIEAWGRTAELCGQYLHKGSAVFIEGRLKLDQWEKDGQKHSKLKVVADGVQFGDKKGETGPRAERPATSRPAEPAGGGSDSDPPFLPRGEFE